MGLLVKRKIITYRLDLENSVRHLGIKFTFFTICSAFQLEHAIENLNGANHIRPHSKGYMLSNSRKGETHIYDRNFQLLDNCPFRIICAVSIPAIVA
jgi:hypothetical protein